MIHISPDIPPFLKAGDRVCLVSTARKISYEELAPAVKILESWNLEVVTGPNVYAVWDQFAGTDSQRLNDLQWALDSAVVRAIFCTRGGYGTSRILDQVNWVSFNKNPKWVVGFSDATVLLNKIASFNISSLHAPMPLFYDKKEYAASVEMVKKFLFGNLPSLITPSSAFSRTGTARGRLAGGNLSLLVNSLGTDSDFVSEGSILFMEDVDEYLYHIDRMILHLKRAGKLKDLAGLIVGHFTGMKDNTIPFGKNVIQIITDLTREYNYPVVFNFPAGHQADNFPLPIGRIVNLVSGVKEVKVEFC